MADVEQRWSISQAHVAEREGIGLPLPVIWRGQAECVAPSVVGVELQPMPLLLAEVELKTVIVRVSLSDVV